MRMPEEIKMGLECCNAMDCDECPYHGENDCSYLPCDDALTLIQQLEEQIPRWVSVKERQPTVEESHRCHTVKVRCDGRPGCYTECDAFYSASSDTWSIYTDAFGDEKLPVTHWLWLPEIPEPEEE